MNRTIVKVKDLWYNLLKYHKYMVNKKREWIQSAFEKIRAKGTQGVCTGKRFGGPTCPPGSKRYNMAKALRGLNKSKGGD